MENSLVVQSIRFALLRNEAGELVHVESDYCKSDLLNFINQNLKQGLDNIPDMKDDMNSIINEFNKNKRV